MKSELLETFDQLPNKPKRQLIRVTLEPQEIEWAIQQYIESQSKIIGEQIGGFTECVRFSTQFTVNPESVIIHDLAVIVEGPFCDWDCPFTAQVQQDLREVTQKLHEIKTRFKK